MLKLHPSVKLDLALKELLSIGTVEVQIAPTADIFTQAAVPVVQYVVVARSIQVIDGAIRVVPAATRPIVDVNSVLPSLSEEDDAPSVSSVPSCIKCGEDLTEDEQAIYGHLCGLCNSTSQERPDDE